MIQLSAQAMWNVFVADVLDHLSVSERERLKPIFYSGVAYVVKHTSDLLADPSFTRSDMIHVFSSLRQEILDLANTVISDTNEK